MSRNSRTFYQSEEPCCIIETLPNMPLYHRPTTKSKNGLWLDNHKLMNSLRVGDTYPGSNEIIYRIVSFRLWSNGHPSEFSGRNFSTLMPVCPYG
jgi:hypothetical protein